LKERIARKRDSHAIVTAGCNRYCIKSAPERIHALGKGDAVLLRTCRIAPLELQIELAEAGLPLTVPSTGHGRVTDLRFKDVLVCLEALLERKLGRGCNLYLTLRINEYIGRVRSGTVDE